MYTMIDMPHVLNKIQKNKQLYLINRKCHTYNRNWLLGLNVAPPIFKQKIEHLKLEFKTE